MHPPLLYPWPTWTQYLTQLSLLLASVQLLFSIWQAMFGLAIGGPLCMK